MTENSTFIVPRCLWVKNLGVASPHPPRQGPTGRRARCRPALGLIGRVHFPAHSVAVGRTRFPAVVGPRACPGLWGAESFLPCLHLVGLLERRDSLLGSGPGRGASLCPDSMDGNPVTWAPPVWGRFVAMARRGQGHRYTIPQPLLRAEVIEQSVMVNLLCRARGHPDHTAAQPYSWLCLRGGVGKRLAFESVD